MMTAANPISEYEDIIDSRDVIARIEFLADMSEDCTADGDTGLDDDEREELTALRALADEASDCAPDWKYGEALIRDSYFTEYAEELAEDTGMLNDSAQWPYSCIDWEQAACELRMDYTSVEFRGVTYWIR